MTEHARLLSTYAEFRQPQPMVITVHVLRYTLKSNHYIWHFYLRHARARYHSFFCIHHLLFVSNQRILACMLIPEPVSPLMTIFVVEPCSLLE